MGTKSTKPAAEPAAAAAAAAPASAAGEQKGASSDLRAKFGDTERWGDVLRYYPEPAEIPAEFAAQLEGIDLERQAELYSKVLENPQAPEEGSFEPVPDVQVLGDATDEQRNQWRNTGLQATYEGKLALLILAGGAGTRLGFDHPKGMYNLELPSGRTLFELHCRRFLKVQSLAAEACAGSEAAQRPAFLYIMTSPSNDAETQQFFRDNDFFGVDPAQVRFFSQSMLPCFDNDGGKLMLESKDRVAMAADGNGGIYPAMYNKGIIQHMKDNDIDYVHTICIDNALVLGLDPCFMGYVVASQAEVGSLVVPKRDWQEKIGMLVKNNGRFAVAEYSDVSDAMKQATNEDGSLRFLAGNICIHAYSQAFLEQKVVPGYVQQIKPEYYHIARKQIPVWVEAEGRTVKPAEKNGCKLEMFIFDVFELADRMAVLQVDRAEQFSPVKNKSGDGVRDSPATAKSMFSELHRSWVEAAGYNIVGDGVVEVDAEVSFRGEGIAGKFGAEGADIAAPCRLTADGVVSARL